ncbi:MAG: hypothetical protein IPG22_02895 [Acidobacteria bacterium]|nr:hypothetical protein [Acidobacteriota bacterium]
MFRILIKPSFCDPLDALQVTDKVNFTPDRYVEQLFDASRLAKADLN